MALKAKLDAVTKGNMQIDLEVTFSDNTIGFSIKRVLVISEERFETITQAEIVDMIKAEGNRYVKMFNKYDALIAAVGTVINI